MRSLWGRVAGLSLLAGLLVVPATLTATAPAQAATGGTARPTSIALDRTGTSYLGYATGKALSRVNRNGRVLSPVPLDRPGPVNGLASDGTRVWVAYDDSVSVLDDTGRVARHFDRSPGATCAHDSRHHVSRYGGIVLTPDRVVVADRCTPSLEVYDRTTGTLRSRIRLGARAHGLAYLRPAFGAPARLFAAIPDRGVVQVFGAGRLTAKTRPSRVVHLKRPYRGRKPQPGGVVVDRFGILTVSDMVNNAIYLVNTRQKYRTYNTLGHPTGPSDSDGSLSYPSAIAQYAQDGSGFSGNVFIADTRNGRVQRWDIGGYTHWVRPLTPPRVGDPADPDPVDPGEPSEPDPVDPDPATPDNTAAPSISVTSGGGALLCSTGSWSSPASFGYQWLRDGVVVTGVSGNEYALTAADDGTEIVCRVTARTSSGQSSTAASDPWFVGTAVAPDNTTPPSINGTPAQGRTLTCATGSWTGTPAPRFAFVWLRNGVQIAGATTSTYVVRSADVGAQLGCTVTGTNQAGADSAVAASVTPTGPVVTPPADPCRGTPRVTIAGGATYVRRPQVTLTIVVPADATAIQVSNTASFSGARTVSRGARCSAPWTLAAPRSDSTPARVWVRWTGGSTAGRTVSDTVRFDRTGPRLTSATVRYAKRHWTLRLKASDANGIATVTYGRTRTSGLRTVRASGAVRVSSPAAARWVRVTDRLGNQSRWLRVD